MSCAYSGRIAVAYRYGDIRAQPNHPEEKFINLYVAIFECESTGAFFFSLSREVLKTCLTSWHCILLSE